VQRSIKEANQISEVPEENHALLISISQHPYAGETSDHSLDLSMLNKTNTTTNVHGTKSPTFQTA
jgi:hypothetical protein